jgi:uncharacterized protein (DUF2249 family)/hemerythrin superfamily protein
MPTTRELDLRPMPPPMRHGLVFQCFDALAIGESILIVNDHDPMPLLQQFKFARPGESEYEYLERGPESWQVRVRRKAAGLQASDDEETGSTTASSAESDSVSEYLQADHRRLDGILVEAQRLVAAGDYPSAAARFAEFSSGLDRHIDVEEQILFPTFESATGMRGGPTQVMRAEHIQIRDSMRTATDALARAEGEVLGVAIHELTETLSAHNMKEEHMLYPMTDQAIHGDEQRRQLVSRLQAF